MNLKDRINNIKELLHYCDNGEFEFFDKKCAKFFKQFFDNERFYKHPYWDEPTIEIGLYLESVAEIPTIYLRYEYEWDREGSDCTFLIFNDDDAKYKYVTENGFGAYGNRNSKDGHGELEYSDFPDWVWETLQNNIYEKVKDILRKKMESARDYYLNLAKLKYEEKLMTYNKIVEKYEQSIN